MILISSLAAEPDPHPVLELFSGIVWGFSLVVPGLSSSSILLFMGIYDKIMAGVGSLNFSIIIPLFLGIALVAVLCAHLVDSLFEKHHGTCLQTRWWAWCWLNT